MSSYGLEPQSVPLSSIPNVVEMIRRNADRAKNFAVAFSSAIELMITVQGRGNTLSERDARIALLKDAMVAYFVGDAVENIAALESRSYQAFATPETLVELTRARDRVADQLEAFNRQASAFEDLPQDVPGMGALRGVLDAQLIPLKNQLQDLEEQISAVQKQLECAESTSAAEGHSLNNGGAK